jgi:hypothetical protein
MKTKKFLQTRQTKGVPLTAMTLTACVTSLILIVACLEGGTTTGVLPNSTQQHITGNSPHNLINNTVDNFESQHRSTIELLSGKESNKDPVVQYLGVPDVFHNLSTEPEERTNRTTDLAGDTIKQTFKPVEGTNGLQWLQNVYNPFLWGSSPPGELGPKCKEDMRSYLTSLKNGSVWASKSKYLHSTRHTVHYRLESELMCRALFNIIWFLATVRFHD